MLSPRFEGVICSRKLGSYEGLGEAVVLRVRVSNCFCFSAYFRSMCSFWAIYAYL